MKKRIKDALDKRKLVKDTFRNTYGYSWDYVMVFRVAPVEEKMTQVQNENSLKFILGRISDAGLQNRLFYSVQRDEVYCKIRCPMPRLLREADRINYRLRLEPAGLANKLREGHLKGPIEKQWKSVEVPSTSIETDIDPYEYIHCDYRQGEDPMYQKYGVSESVLRGVDRLKLIANIIAARLSDGGAFLDVHRLIKTKCMITFFPLHDAVELRDLEEKWLRMCQPPWTVHPARARLLRREDWPVLFVPRPLHHVAVAGLDCGFLRLDQRRQRGQRPRCHYHPLLCGVCRCVVYVVSGVLEAQGEAGGHEVGHGGV